MWTDYIRKQRPHENDFRELMVDLFDRQQNMIISNLEEKKSQLGSTETKDLSEEELKELLFTIHEEAEYFMREGTPYFEETIQDLGSSELDKLQTAVDFNLNNPRVQQFISNKRQQFAVGVNNTTWQTLKDGLMEGTKNGESIDDLEERVKEIFTGAKANRSRLIARTEVNGSANFGSHEAYRQSGVVEKESWIAALDERTRTAHRNAHNQTVGIDEMFDVGGENLEFPGDPRGSASNVINCRCTLIPITDEDE